MALCTVTILPDDRVLEVESGSLLLQACFSQGVAIDSPCGGRGTCKKCRVIVDGKEDLACKVIVDRDMSVEIPEDSRLQKQQVLLDKPGEGLRALKWELKALNPIAQRITLRLDMPTLDENTNDLDRVRIALRKHFGADSLISLNALQRLPEVMREQNGVITATMVFNGRFWKMIEIVSGEAQRPLCGLAIDIGTTTVAISLVNLETGVELAKRGRYNLQSVFGSDVISRMIYAEEKGDDGLQQLHKASIDTINELIEGLLEATELQRTDIKAAVVAGNTVMTHFFMGVSPKYLRLEPYIPAAIEFPSAQARRLNLGIHPDAFVMTMPNVASYVGGDITAGVLATGLHEIQGDIALFLDIGTNGELVLGNAEWMMTCACSAGPAFEGSGIACGMRAMDGAINAVEIDPDTWEPRLSTIAQQPPAGICGSGLIDVLAKMRAAGVIDRSGLFNRKAETSRLRFLDGEAFYILAYAGEYGNDKEIFLSEDDAKNILRAKGAVFAGIKVMLDNAGLDFSAIDRVIIAGGFGSFINVSDAIEIGLLPDIDEAKFSYVGNRSLHGALELLLDRAKIHSCRDIANGMTYLELSNGNHFMEEFVSAMFIPHTDLSLFPNRYR